MTGCLNGGSCLLDKKRETFACSCKLPWSGQRCQVNSSEPFLSFRVFCFIIINSIFFHEKKKVYVLTSSVLMLILFLIFVTKLPGRPVCDARLMASSAGYIPGEGLNFSSFVLNRILELSRKCFKRTRKHLASGIFATRELKTPRQRGQRERQKNIRLNRQKNNSLFCSFRFFWPSMHDYDELLRRERKKYFCLSNLGYGP